MLKQVDKLFADKATHNNTKSRSLQIMTWKLRDLKRHWSTWFSRRFAWPRVALLGWTWWWPVAAECDENCTGRGTAKLEMSEMRWFVRINDQVGGLLMSVYCIVCVFWLFCVLFLDLLKSRPKSVFDFFARSPTEWRMMTHDDLWWFAIVHYCNCIYFDLIY